MTSRRRNYCVYDVPENRVIAYSSVGPYHFAAHDRQTDPEQEHRMEHRVRYPYPEHFVVEHVFRLRVQLRKFQPGVRRVSS